jgi:hypothetical protein
MLFALSINNLAFFAFSAKFFRQIACKAEKSGIFLADDWQKDAILLIIRYKDNKFYPFCQRF